jgi:hypothetical protein
MLYHHSGEVIKTCFDGFVYVYDKCCRKSYIINIAHYIENYRGESLWELGIHKKTPCIFILVKGKIHKIYFYTRIPTLVKILKTLEKLTTKVTKV